MPLKVKYDAFICKCLNYNYLMFPEKSAPKVYHMLTIKMNFYFRGKTIYQYLWKYLVFLHTFFAIDRCDLFT